MPTCHVVSPSAARVGGRCGDRWGPQRAVGRLLRGEDGRVDDHVAGRDRHGRVIRCHDRHEVVVRPAPGQGRQVVRPIDGRAVVGIVGSRDDHGPDPGVDQALELRRDALDRSARLDVAVEQVAGDQEEVDLLCEGQIDGRDERRELTLALGRSLLAKIVVSRAEMDVSGVDDPEHPPGVSPPCQHGLRWQRGSKPLVRVRRWWMRARRPHDSSPATRILAASL